MIRISNNRLPQPSYTSIWDVEIVINFLDTLDSDKIELKLLTQKLTMLLALPRSARAHELLFNPLSASVGLI